MSNAFDIEAAKRGEPVEIFYARTAEWGWVHFIGTMTNGTVLVEDQRGVTHHVPDTRLQLLRMVPKKVRVRYRVGLFHSVFKGLEPFTLATQSEDEAKEWEGSNTRFARWLTDWTEVEVPQ
jgi:hypothetical protein